MMHKSTPVIPDQPYPFSTIWANGRYISIEKIVHQEAEAQTPFESRTFAFIKDWLTGTEDFTLTTSGSTGPPKTITISKKQMVISVMRSAEKLGLQKNTRALVCIDTKYIGGLMMVARCLTLGLKMMILDPVANPLVKIPVHKCVQFTAFVPYQIAAMLESKHPHLLNTPRQVIIGGASLHPKYIEQLDRYLCEFYETYGMTETLSHVALRLLNTTGKQQYFETLPGVSIRQDDRGCLVVEADYLSAPVVTNDLVDIVAPGKFTWLGRWDNVINTGGVKVMPEKVEKVIGDIFYKHGFNYRFFVAALPDEKLSNKIILVIEGVEFSSEILQAALADVRTQVSSYEFPKEVYSHPSFATTGSHKVDRNETLPGITRLPITLP